jgi:polar amino acid transport system permease protein
MDYEFQFHLVLNNVDMMLNGALLTTLLAVVAISCATLIGTVLAIVRLGNSPVLRRLIDGYVEIIRNTPFIVQLFFIVFGIPTMGLQIGLFEAAVVALVINLSGYTTEIVRAGLESTHPSQFEAGYSLGLGRWQVYRYVVVPPAIERVYPALCSQFVLAMLGTSIVSQISVEELTGIAALISARSYRAFETYIILAGFYVGLTFLFRAAFYVIGRVAFPWRKA